jgi:membrane protein implicated in regulation of membrane protease activity
MGKILAFLIGTIGLSLLLLIPVLYLFGLITAVIIEVGFFKECLPSIIQGFVLIAIVLVSAVATLVALLLWEVR